MDDEQPYLFIYGYKEQQMGIKCSWCPLGKQQSNSDTDTLSKRSDLAMNGEIQQKDQKKTQKKPPQKKITDKKISKDTSIQLKRQESRYFQKHKAFQKNLINKQTPLLSPHKKSIVQKQIGEDHMTYYSRIKQKIRPNLTKLSTMDEDQSSKGQYYKDISNQSDQPSQIYQDLNESIIKFQANRNNLSLSFPSLPISLQQQYRTTNNKNPIKKATDIKILYSIEAESTAEPSSLLSCFFQIAQHKFHQHDLVSCQLYLSKAINCITGNTILEKNDNYLKIYTLAGSVHLLKGNPGIALEYLLKALKQQINAKGIDSIRLIQVYYWLGEVYLKLDKRVQAKDHYNKAYRLYFKYEVKQPKLMAALCNRLGKANNQQEEYAQADRYYNKGIKQTEQSGDIGAYVELMLRSAQNQLDMGNNKICLAKYRDIFKLLERFQWQNQIVNKQVEHSMGRVILTLAKMNHSQEQLNALVRISSEICPNLSELNQLKSKVLENISDKKH